MLTAGPRRTVPVAWRLSGHARRLVTLALAALFLAVVTRRAEFAGLAAPAVLLLIPRQSSRPAAIGLTLAAGADQVTEGEQATVLAQITGHGEAAARLRLYRPRGSPRARPRSVPTAGTGCRSWSDAGARGRSAPSR